MFQKLWKARYRRLSAHFYSQRRIGDGISNHNPKGKEYDYEHSEPYSLVMFNRDGMRHQSVSPHNIYETMSRSRKRMPGSTWCCCKSQKKGKQASSRKYRRRTKVLLHQGNDHLLPLKSFEVMSPWDLGGDGKHFWGFHPEEEWYVKLMRKWFV